VSSKLSLTELSLMANVARQADMMLAHVLEWSAINSGSRNLPGLAHMADVLGAAFAPLGPVERRPPAPVTHMDAQGRAVPLVHGDNLLLSLRPDLPRRIMLVGHMDTVFPPDHPFQTASWLDERTLNGPGVADMKGGIAIMLAALTALEASGLSGPIGIDVVLNADEEVSSLGSAALLAEIAARAQIGLCFEPAQTPEGILAGERKGSGNFSLSVKGRSAHAGRNPQDGRNALLAAAEIALGLERLDGGRPALTINPARIDGGSANNVVPDHAVLRFNVRVAEPEDQDWFLKKLGKLTADITRKREVEILPEGAFFRPPKPMDEKQLGLFQLVRACGADLGLDIEWKSSGGVCDGNNLAAHGLAVVDTLGVRGGAIHSADEFLLVDSLVERAQLTALLLARISSGNGPSAARSGHLP
jgi:glutamate carboxypeptidase